MVLNIAISKISHSFDRLTSIQMLAFIIISNLVIFCLSDRFILTDKLIFENLSQSFSAGQLDQMIDTVNRVKYFAYPILAISLYMKILAIAAAVYAGFYLSNLTISFSFLLKSVCMAEVVFLIPLFWKLTWFAFFMETYTYDDVQHFYPLSLLTLFDPNSLQSWWIYPLQILNFFELGFILILAAAIQSGIRKDYDYSLKLVLYTYCPALFSWTVIVMFISLIFGGH